MKAVMMSLLVRSDCAPHRSALVVDGLMDRSIKRDSVLFIQHSWIAYLNKQFILHHFIYGLIETIAT